MAFPYAFRVAARSIIHEKWINLLSILTMAAGLLFTAITILSIYNVDIATKRLPEKFSMMLYLNDNLSQEELKNIMNTIREDGAVETVKYISKDEALKELEASLKDIQYVLNGLGENPLADSIEVKLKKEAVQPETVKRLAAKIEGLEGIGGIEYGEKFLASIYSINVGMKTIGIIFVTIMSAGMIFVCYSTVKILFYRKNQEIETYKLLGAKKGFIRTPFIIEGAVIGLSAGLLSFVGILSLYYMIIFRLSLTIPLFKAIVFPTDIAIFLPLVGLIIGMIGAAIAIGRIRY
ncbi:MAG: permease-like cell division protein FtsX [Nitrospirota bacterium]